MTKAKSQLIPISRLLGKAVAGKDWKEGLQLGKLMARWETIVGQAIAQHAQPVRMQRTTLVLTVTNHAWMQELGFLKQDILKKISAAFPRLVIKELRFELKREC